MNSKIWNFFESTEDEFQYSCEVLAENLIHTEEAKKNMSGRELSDEHKKAISNYMTGKKHTLGRKHTDEWKQEAKIRMSKRKRDSKGRMMKGVIQ